jgi:hypothetical protein
MISQGLLDILRRCGFKFYLDLADGTTVLIENAKSMPKGIINNYWVESEEPKFIPYKDMKDVRTVH